MGIVMIKHFGFRVTIFSITSMLLKPQEVVKCLVEAGARIDKARGDDRRSPLHMAVQHGQLEVVRFLLQAPWNRDADLVLRTGKVWNPEVVCGTSTFMRLLSFCRSKVACHRTFGCLSTPCETIPFRKLQPLTGRVKFLSCCK